MAPYVVLDHVVNRNTWVVVIDVDELWIMGRVRWLLIVEALELWQKAARLLSWILLLVPAAIMIAIFSHPVHSTIAATRAAAKVKAVTLHNATIFIACSQQVVTIGL